MQLSQFLSLGALPILAFSQQLPIGAASAAQVNFYWDDNCTPDQFAGASFPELGQVAGGPFGSRSMYLVSMSNNCIRSFPTVDWCMDDKCSNHERAEVGECKHYEDGNWAKPHCEFR